MVDIKIRTQTEKLLDMAYTSQTNVLKYAISNRENIRTIKSLLKILYPNLTKDFGDREWLIYHNAKIIGFVAGGYIKFVSDGHIVVDPKDNQIIE